jgi:hypothetical protein
MMSTKQMMALAMAALFTMTLAGEVMARGGNGGGGRNMSASANRPAGSQRRDGTFLSTGTTANGGTTRPANGNGTGPRDGSCLTSTPPAPAAN